jgi:hypothetical protein
LKELGFFNDRIDSNFGQNTLLAVTNFQRAVGTKSDGIVGSLTWNKMMNYGKEVIRTSGIPYDISYVNQNGFTIYNCELNETEYIKEEVKKNTIFLNSTSGGSRPDWTIGGWEKDYIKDKNSLIFVQEPYLTTTHINKHKHLIESWCDLCDVKYNHEQPELFFNFRQYETTPIFKLPDTKPALLFQPFGGMKGNQEDYTYSWARDIHPQVAQTIVNELSKIYNIIHICYDYHPQLQNVIRYDKIIPKMQLFALLPQVHRRLFIDSSLQHAAAAMKQSSTVVWNTTSPVTFGYDTHTNILSPTPKTNGHIDAFLFDYSLNGQPYECPYSNILDMYDVEKILKTFI